MKKILGLCLLFALLIATVFVVDEIQYRTAVPNAYATPTPTPTPRPTAATITTYSVRSGSLQFFSGEITLTASYPSNGYDLSILGPEVVEFVVLDPQGYQFEYVKSTMKLRIRQAPATPGPFTEMTDDSSLTGITIHFAGFRHGI